MADITFSKSNCDYYYLQSSGTGTQVNTSSTYTIRNSTSTNSWIRTKGFTTGTKRVTKLRVTHIDANGMSPYTATCGISTSLISWANNKAVPACNWVATGNFTYQSATYNQWYCDINCDLMPGTTYYLYIWVNYSGGAWGVLTYPYSGSGNSSRSTKTELTFTTASDAGMVRIYTSSGWKQAIPYIYTSGGWKQAMPYVYTSNGWKLCN